MNRTDKPKLVSKTLVDKLRDEKGKGVTFLRKRLLFLKKVHILFLES